MVIELAFGWRSEVLCGGSPDTPLASDDRPPQRPPRPPAPRASVATPAKPAARTSGAQPAGDKVAAAYQDLLQEIIDKKQKSAEIRRRPPKRRKGPLVKAVLAVILPPLAAALWIFNPFEPGPPPAPRIPDDAATWRATLIDAAEAIKEWRDSAGGFPIDLASADIPLKGVTFEVTGPEQFTLQTFTSEGIVTVWMDDTILGVGPRPVAAETPPEATVTP